MKGMRTMIKERITLEDRIIIEELLRLNFPLKKIAYTISKYPSTVSREIKNRRTHNEKAIICYKTKRYPFICTNCHKKYNCSMRKYYYSYKKAHEDYLSKLSNSRRGIDMDIDQIEYWNDYFRDKLKNKNQPITHIFNSMDSAFPKTIQTFYNYIHKGYFPSINDEMLARSFSYKIRIKQEIVKTISRESPIRNGRKFDDFKKHIEQNKNSNIVEMDTVIGKFEDKKCILTLYFRKEKLMLMFLINKYKPSEVSKIFNLLKRKLGDSTFKKLFEVILTDNGWEFSKPEDIEFNYDTGEKLINLYYCESYSSWQKGGIERNHEFIRYIIPKGISFDNLKQKDVTNMMNHINNVKRKSLDYQTPYDLFNQIYGDEICKLLHLIYIPKNEVDLSYKILK
jgi:IS30 family transposase